MTLAGLFRLADQVSGGTEPSAFLPRDRALSQYNSFSGKVVLKGHVSVTLRKPLLICSCLLGERTL